MEKIIILRAKKGRTIFLLIVCLFFVLAPVLINKKYDMIDWGSSVFFGAGVIIYLIQLLPNSSYLKLDEEGFELKSTYKLTYTKWSDVDRFKVGYIKTRYSKTKMIMLDYSEKYKKHKTGREISNYISGADGALPDNYGMKIEQLVKLMNEWKSENKTSLNNINK